MATKLDKDILDKISFITFIIPMFASAFKMNKQKAFLYLEKYGGFDYINDCWWALHTDNPYWAIRDIYKVCLSNGGLR
jgi:hypothetical protein